MLQEIRQRALLDRTLAGGTTNAVKHLRTTAGTDWQSVGDRFVGSFCRAVKWGTGTDRCAMSLELCHQVSARRAPRSGSRRTRRGGAWGLGWRGGCAAGHRDGVLGRLLLGGISVSLARDRRNGSGSIEVSAIRVRGRCPSAWHLTSHRRGGSVACLLSATLGGGRTQIAHDLRQCW